MAIPSTRAELLQQLTAAYGKLRDGWRSLLDVKRGPNVVAPGLARQWRCLLRRLDAGLHGYALRPERTDYRSNDGGVTSDMENELSGAALWAVHSSPTPEASPSAAWVRSSDVFPDPFRGPGEALGLLVAAPRRHDMVRARVRDELT